MSWYPSSPIRLTFWWKKCIETVWCSLALGKLKIAGTPQNRHVLDRQNAFPIRRCWSKWFQNGTPESWILRVPLRKSPKLVDFGWFRWFQTLIESVFERLWDIFTVPGPRWATNNDIRQDQRDADLSQLTDRGDWCHDIHRVQFDSHFGGKNASKRFDVPWH